MAPDLATLNKMSESEAVPAVEVEARFTKPEVVLLPVQVLPVVAISRSLPLVTELEVK